ncbi:hypothetical protein ScalyP_jg10879 [Parmales sp. scaly parma]|nr:hypothetical protein ScalyP_jg10879 [Parmales sp. scaly parma]
MEDISTEEIPTDMEECRICRDEFPPSLLLAPCKCSGSIKFICKRCLTEWCKTSPANMTQCNVCHEKWKIKIKYPPVLAVARSLVIHIFTKYSNVKHLAKAILDGNPTMDIVLIIQLYLNLVLLAFSGLVSNIIIQVLATLLITMVRIDNWVDSCVLNYFSEEIQLMVGPMFEPLPCFEKFLNSDLSLRNLFRTAPSAAVKVLPFRTRFANYFSERFTFETLQRSTSPRMVGNVFSPKVVFEQFGAVTIGVDKVLLSLFLFVILKRKILPRMTNLLEIVSTIAIHFLPFQDVTPMSFVLAFIPTLIPNAFLARKVLHQYGVVNANEYPLDFGNEFAHSITLHFLLAIFFQATMFAAVNSFWFAGADIYNAGSKFVLAHATISKDV